MTRDDLRRYFVHDLGWGWGYQQEIVFGFLCEAAEEVGGGVLLDAGAGHQRYKPFFAEAIYLAQEHPEAGAANKGIEKYDILCDVATIPLNDNSVDLVLSTSSLEHMEFPEKFFAEAHRVLRPGGSLYVNVPFVYAEHETPYDFQRPTRYGLRRFYHLAGFEKVTVAPTSSSIYTAQFSLKSALAEDCRRRAGSLSGRIMSRLLQLAAKWLCGSLMKHCDRGPAESTTLPIGWIAKGCKPGINAKSCRYPSKEAFLRANAWREEQVSP